MGRGLLLTPHPSLRLRRIYSRAIKSVPLCPVLCDLAIFGLLKSGMICIKAGDHHKNVATLFFEPTRAINAADLLKLRYEEIEMTAEI
jgi:hypothetical protein